MPQIHASSPFNATPWVLTPTMSPRQSHLHGFMVHFHRRHFPLKDGGPKGHHHPSFQFTSLQMVPTPPILYMHIRGRRRGCLSTKILGSSILSSTSRRGRPSYQTMLSDLMVNIPVQSRNGHECWVKPNLLQEGPHMLDNCVVPFLGVLGGDGIHLNFQNVIINNSRMYNY